MTVINNVWYAKPTCSNVTAAPPVVMGDLNLDYQIKAFLHDVPPTVCFGRLVFEHTGDLNFKLIEIKNPKSLRTVKEVITPFGQSLQINLAVQITAPNSKNEESGDEVIFEGRPISMGQSK